jgi:uncharacterized YccA/Bax inhibitor family protein
MTLRGTVNKTFVLLFLTIATAAYAWINRIPVTSPIGLIGLIGGTVTCLVLCFKQEWAPALAPTYAILKGIFLGAISATLERQYSGIVGQAVMLTFGTFFAMLAAYSTGAIRPSENFKLGIIAATGGIFVVYLATIVLGMFGVQIPYIHQGGMIGIGFSLFVVVIAALNLVLDFDFIEQGCEVGAPKYMEWYAGFGLLVTLVWLYIEILRLLSKMRSR